MSFTKVENNCFGDRIIVYCATILKTIVSIGVRGGGSRGAAAPPGLKNFRANSVFRASASCSKILNDKK